MLPTLPLGIIAALDAEARLVAGHNLARLRVITTSNNNELIYLSGMGADAARHAARQLLLAGAKALISWGTAGSLSSQIRPGDLLLAEQVMTVKKHFPTDIKCRESIIHCANEAGLPFHTQGIFTSGDAVTTAHAKEILGIKTGCGAVDMESAAIAEVAFEAGVPFVTLRSIVDAADQAIPSSAINSVDHFGKVNIPKLITNLACSPGEIPELLRLGKHFKLASRQLTAIKQAIDDHALFEGSTFSQAIKNPEG